MRCFNGARSPLLNVFLDSYKTVVMHYSYSKLTNNSELTLEGLSSRIVIDSEVLSGKPVIKGTRIPVYLIIELLANGLTEKEVLRQYPTLKKEDIKAALLYASKCIENEE